jgi:hypothetical protein
MKSVLLMASAALAAGVIAATPAGAQRWAGSSFDPSVTVHRGSPDFRSGERRLVRDFACLERESRRDGRRHDGRRHRRSADCAIFAGPWAYYGDFDANRSFDADRWNDWWHERPWRSYPRWVQHKESCEPERMWWSGRGWHC